MRSIAIFLGILAAGCAAVLSSELPVPARQHTTPAVQSAPRQKGAPSRGNDLYPLDEVLKDALVGPWEHLGTGPWYGNARLHACAYRNARVLIVNEYCASKEPNALRLDVYSPTRGWVSIYAEARGPVSRVRRRHYFSFNAAAQPPPRPEAGLSPLALTMSFAELQRYDQQRSERFLPLCYGGVELRRPRYGCVGDLVSRAAQWAERNRAFLVHPPEDWYHLVRELHALAAKHGQTTP